MFMQSYNKFIIDLLLILSFLDIQMNAIYHFAYD